MNFKEMLLEMLLEGKLEDTLVRHPTILHDVKQDFLSQIPAKNAQHLDWVLSQHTKGIIKPEHDINGILSNFNKVRDKLSKKQIHQYSSMDELHAAITPHQDNIKKSDNEKSKDGTETLYSSPTMTITQHHNYESTVGAANLPENNVSKRDKAGWCVSVGDGGGAGHYSTYTSNGFHPVYTIEHKHEDGTSSKHMLVYDHNKTQDKQELRDENDKRPGFNDYSSTRPDLLDHYGTEHPELKKTPIAHLFNETGREQYKSDTEPAHKKLLSIIRTMGNYEIPDDEYMDYFNAGLEKRQGGIHDELAKSQLSKSQLSHLIEHGNQGCKHILANRSDLSETHMNKLANTSNILVHNMLLNNTKLTDSAFGIITKKSHNSMLDTVIQHPKFNATHIDSIINRKNISITRDLIRRFSTELKPHQIDKLVDSNNEVIHNSLKIYNTNDIKKHHIDKLLNTTKKEDVDSFIYKFGHMLSHEHVKTLINNGHDIVINNTLHILPSEAKQELLKHAEKLKNDNNLHWTNLYNVHGSMQLSPIDRTKNSVMAASSHHYPTSTLYNGLTDEELATHIHPIINNIIDTAKNDDTKSRDFFVKYANMLNTTQAQSLLNNFSKEGKINLPEYSIPDHVANTVIAHAIKTSNHNLAHDMLSTGKYVTYTPSNISTIKKAYPEHMPLIDKDGEHAAELLNTAIKNKDRKTIMAFRYSTNNNYKNAVSSHPLLNESINKFEKILFESISTLFNARQVDET